MRRAAKLLSAVIVLLALAAGLLAWRLWRGPILLTPLTPYIERALNAPHASVRVTVGATELAWTGWRRGIVLRARDVRVATADGQPMASLPALALRMALRPLLHRQVALTRIDVLSPVLRVVREPDGRFGLGLGSEVEARPENPVGRDVISALLTAEQADSPLAHLRRVEIADGEVVVEDRSTGLVGRVPRIHLSLARNDRGITAALSGALVYGTQAVSVEANAQLEAADRALDLQLSFHDLNPSGIGTQLAADGRSALPQRYPEVIKTLTGVVLSLSGSIQARLDAALHATSVRVQITAPQGTMALPAFGAQPLDIGGLQLAMHFDAAADEAVIDTITLDLGGPSLTASARLSGLSGDRALTADATLAGLPVDALARYWPLNAAAGTRQWLTTNLSQGTVPRATAHLEATLGGNGAPASFTLGALRGAVAYDKLSVRYLPTMPAVTGVSGNGTFTADRWDLRVDAGTLRQLRLGSSSVTISAITGTQPTRIAIAATVDGPLADALGVLDAQPLGIPKQLGIDPAHVSGAVNAQVGFDFPLADRIGLDNLGLTVAARLADVQVPRAIQDWSVSDGKLQIDVDGAGLRLGGRARLEGTPLDVDWYEAFAPRVRVRRHVTVKGDVDARGRTALGFDLLPWLDGSIGLDVQLTQPDNANGRMSVRIDLAAAQIDVPSLQVRKAPGQPGEATGTVRLARTGVTAVDPFQLTMPGCEVLGRAERNGTRWQTVDASGALGKVLQATGQPARFDLAVRPAGAVESFRLTSEDVAALARAAEVYADGYGGHLEATGTIDLTGARHTFDGHIQIHDFTITQAPVLAQLLTMASFSGIANTLTNKGVTFSRIAVQATGDRDHASIADLVAVGDALGIAGTGSIDMAADTVDMSGSVVPAYYGINPVIGKIPVLRDLLSGSHGLGVLGVDFSVTGPLSSPKVAVHPLQSITPDLVNRLSALLPTRKQERSPGKRWW